MIALSSWFIVHKIHLKRVDLLSANIEALTQDESIAVKTCYMENLYAGNTMTWFLKCDPRTSSEMIYKCPESESYGIKGVQSLCIK